MKAPLDGNYGLQIIGHALVDGEPFK